MEELAHQPGSPLPLGSIAVTAQKAFFLPHTSREVAAMVAQLWEYTKSHCILHLRKMKFLVCELYLNRSIFKKKALTRDQLC